MAADSWIRLTHRPQWRFAFLAGPGSLFIIIAMLLPLLTIVVFSFWRTESYEIYADWNLDNYRLLLGEAAYRIFFLRSLITSVLVSLACLVIAWPIAYFIARYGGRYRLLLVLLLAAPFFTGIILRVTGLQALFGPIGLINMTLGEIGIPPIGALMYTQFAAGVGLVATMTPPFVRRCTTSAEVMVWSMTACIRSTISLGVPAGRNTPCQELALSSGNPCSVVVAVSGNCSMRLGVLTASAFSRPARTCPSADDAVTNMRCVSAATRPLSAGPAPPL